MTQTGSLRRACLLVLGVLVLAASAEGGGRSVSRDDASGRPWSEKLDPFLRRLVFGTSRIEGRFRTFLPPRSTETARSIPSFLQVARDGTRVHVKAGLTEEAAEIGGGWPRLAPVLAAL